MIGAHNSFVSDNAVAVWICLCFGSDEVDRQVSLKNSLKELKLLKSLDTQSIGPRCWALGEQIPGENGFS